MPTDAEYKSMIQQFDNWKKLTGFLGKIQKGDTPGWAAGKAFEYLVLQAFNLDGGAVRWPYPVEIENEVVEQIDGFVHIGRFSCVVESKHTGKAVAIAPLAKMRNQLMRRHSGAIGLVFSFSGFTNAAVILARYIAPQAILLWTGRSGRGVRLGFWLFVESLASMSSTGEMPRRLRIHFEGAIYHVMASASPSPTGR